MFIGFVVVAALIAVLVSISCAFLGRHKWNCKNGRIKKRYSRMLSKAIVVTAMLAIMAVLILGAVVTFGPPTEAAAEEDPIVTICAWFTLACLVLWGEKTQQIFDRQAEISYGIATRAQQRAFKRQCDGHPRARFSSTYLSVR